MAIENREIKSSVFADLFGDDELDGKKNFLSLYNAIHDTDLKLENTQIIQKKIPQSVYKTFNNDVSMLINGRLIVLIEHQSTPNQNMPLRFLEYYVHILYGIIPADVRYREAIFKIPTPEFYVFYNGKRDPKEKEYIMKLSDAFIESQKEPLCELKVKFISITKEMWQNLPVVQKCDILKQYCEFMDIVMRYLAEMQEHPTVEERQGAYEKAIREAISKGILTDYLTRKGTEVMNMFIDEYNYDLDMKVKAEEAEKRGIEKGAQQKAIENAQKLLADGKYTAEEISELFQIPVEAFTDKVKVILNGN